MRDNKIHLCPSLFPIDIDWEKILQKAKKYNVYVYPWYRMVYNFSIDDIEKIKKYYFNKFTLNLQEYDVDNSKCLIREDCNCLDKGRMYFCPMPAYVRHFNKKFGTDFKPEPNDYLYIYKINSEKEIENFLNSEHSFCKKCLGLTALCKWESSKEHTIDEWSLSKPITFQKFYYF